MRETQIQADIAIEGQRAGLVDQRVSNERKEAEARGDALRATLAPLKDVDWRTLMAISGGTDAKAIISMAFRDLADNASKIGQLNISPDLLTSLLQDGKSVTGQSSAGIVAEPHDQQRPRKDQH